MYSKSHVLTVRACTYSKHCELLPEARSERLSESDSMIAADEDSVELATNVASDLRKVQRFGSSLAESANIGPECRQPHRSVELLKILN